MYTSVNQYYRQKFGCKIYKLSIDAGFTCPNRDGTLGTGGCIFCSGSGSGDFSVSGSNISEQIQQAKALVQHKNKGGKYLVYFQAFTNTYGPVSLLEQRYREALQSEEIVGLSIATRPDCLSNEVIELLQKLNRETYICVELGLQTSHEETARYIRRGYPTPVYDDAVRRLKAAGIEVVTHIILGLPGETAEIMLETTRHAVEAGTDGIKFQLLHVLKGTDLAKEYESGKFQCLTFSQYSQILKSCLSTLPPEVIVHRITGDGAKRDLIAPLWSADKKRVLNDLNKILFE